MRIAQQVITVLSMTYDVYDTQVTIGATVGISLKRANGTDATSLFRRADRP
jgi:predicted signal transduction protein with EAL and GGDEF domain